MKAILIKENSRSSYIMPKNGTDFELDELQKAVGGLIDIIRLNENDLIMVINDEGKFTCGKNKAATEIAHRCNAIYADDYIAGDVIICEDEMVK